MRLDFCIKRRAEAVSVTPRGWQTLDAIIVPAACNHTTRGGIGQSRPVMCPRIG